MFGLVCDIIWNYDKCVKILQQSNSANITQLPVSTNTIPFQQPETQSRDKLTIIQLNADGIRPNLLELRGRLINLDIDIVAIQESQLFEADKTLSNGSYATIRKDQNNIHGGGLLFFVHSGVMFEKLHSFKKSFESAHQNHYGWKCTIPNFSRPT